MCVCVQAIREREREEEEVKQCSVSSREKLRSLESANASELTALAKDLDDQVSHLLSFCGGC